tara:strand:- start:140 stop:559 length:420 start_codon:yes stop_codon:yes gene_type:complete
MTFIPEGEYQKIIKKMPVFCVDFLIYAEKKYLLVKRKEEPVKDVYWVIGGRLRYKETMDELAERVQMQEIGRSFPQYKIIGYSNYFFPDTPDARATHTPTLLHIVEANKMFEPKIDNKHTDYIWSEKLPDEMLKQTTWI